MQKKQQVIDKDPCFTKDAKHCPCSLYVINLLPALNQQHSEETWNNIDNVEYSQKMN